MKKYFVMILITLLVVLVGCSEDLTVTNFEECVQAGNDILDSYPAQCIHEGQTFVQETNDKLIIELATSSCVSLCNDAADMNCSDEALASFCLTYANDFIDPYEFIDLNLNKVSDGDNSWLAGIYVCEDAVPCHALIDTCCKRKINHNVCADILNEYWTSNFESEEINELASKIKKGTCDENTSPAHWYYDAGFDEIFE